mmetsp:Transcript_21951/g.35336  ORF Transcript_21951/g.35336 Transcript_21951/m.35336 type:complete len:256 (+) Transcript_21951:940-1707(+)
MLSKMMKHQKGGGGGYLDMTSPQHGGEVPGVESSQREEKGDQKEEEKKKKKRSCLMVYTDGACEGNGKKRALAGYGVYFDGDDDDYDGSRPEPISRPLEGSLQTNQRAEMMAVISAVDVLLKITEKKHLRHHHHHHHNERSSAPTLLPVVILSDSQYTVKGITSWVPNWKRNKWLTATKQPVKNRDLWTRLDANLNRLRALRPIEVKWVRGHSGNFGNEMADRLAVIIGFTKRKYFYIKEHCCMLTHIDKRLKSS